MAGMKITLSSAMRARDVSRPQPQHDAAAQAADAAEPAARPTAGASQRGPAAASPVPSEPVPGTGVKKEDSAADPGTDGQRGGGSRRRRSRRRSGRLAN